MKVFPVVICAALIAGPSFADIRVQFLEGAPKDRFIITNNGTCAVGPAELVIDFSQTGAGLIFDVTGSGAGVEVFQPFEISEGAELLESKPVITDGDQTATLVLNSLAASQRILFTIDVDDTSGARAITVSNNEIDGATASLILKGIQVSSGFGSNAEAVLETNTCAP